MRPTALDIDSIRIDGGTQPRAEIDQGIVAEYAHDIAEGDPFPAVTVFYDGVAYWLADGFHRLWAHQKAGKKQILAVVRRGTQRDAVLWSVGSNAGHGLRRSDRDKRRAIETLLKDAEWGKWSDREIGRRCRVSGKLVASVRSELTSTYGASAESRRCAGPAAEPETRTVKRGETTYQMAVPQRQKQGYDWVAAAAGGNGKAEAAPQAPAAVVRDQVGNVLGSPELIALFGRRDEFTRLMTEVSRIKSAILAGVDAKDPLFAHVIASNIKADCDNLHRHLRFARPHAVCPYCGGMGTSCRTCAGVGFVGEVVYQQCTPAELKGGKR